MAVNLSFIGGAGWQFFDDSGNPLTGGKVYTYAAGTTTPLATYTSRDGNTPNTNPIILDAAGRTPEQIWSTEGVLYKYVIQTANNVLIRVWDNIGGSVVASNLGQDLASTTDNTKGDALIGFRQSNALGFLTGSVGRTVNAKLQESVSVKDFGATGDGVTDDTAAINAAITAANSVFFPPGVYIFSSTITAPNDRYLYSLGSAVLKVGNNISTTFPLCVITSQNVTIENLIFDGNQSVRQTGNAVAGIFFQNGAQNCKLIRCTLRDIGIRPLEPISGPFGTGRGNGITIQGLETDTRDTRDNLIEGCRLEDPNGQLAFGFRFYTDWTLGQDGNTRRVLNNIAKDNLVIGCSWNSFGIEGPGTRGNQIINNTSSGLLGNTGVEADKGASYNSFVGNIVLYPVWADYYGVACFRDAGATGAFPTVYAIGNSWSANVAKITDKPNFASFVGFLAGNSKQCVANGFSIDIDYSGPTSADSIRGAQFFDADRLLFANSTIKINSSTVPLYGIINNSNVTNLNIVNNNIAISGPTLNASCQFTDNASSVKIINNTFTNGVSGFQLTGTANVTKCIISENEFSNHSFAPINMTDAGTVLQGVIANNVIETTGSFAIRSTSIPSFSMVGNVSNAPLLFPHVNVRSITVANTISGAINPQYGTGSLMWSAAVPTTGTWVVGDVVYTVAPSAGGFIGWICVASGTPGTWKTFGPITV